MTWTVRLAAVLAPILFFVSGAHAGTSGDLILRGGAIYTLDAARPWASALVIAGGHIVYVGDDVGAHDYLGPSTRVIELGGRMVLPGFHDAHAHPMTGGMRLLRCRLNELRSLPEMYKAVRACAFAQPESAWLLGSGWSPQAFAGGGPSRTDLDQIVRDRPAFLTTEDGFTAWVNSQALAIAGIDPNGSDPEVEGLERDPKTHTPTGILKGEAANLVRRHIPQPTQAEYREALRRWTEIANRYGITSVFDASANAAVLDAYHGADLAGELNVRVVAAQRIDLDRGEEQIDELIARRDRVRGRRFRADAAKIFLDGEIDMHTAALLEPYADTPGLRGELYIQPDALNVLVRRLDAEGFLIMMHVMGDKSVRAGLDAIEQAIQANGARDRRHQLAHIGVANPDDIRRFGELGVAANFQPIWFHADDPAAAPAEAVLGPERSRWIFPMASIAAGGGLITASSDWPAPSMNPFEIIQVAVTRQPLDGKKPARQPDERVELASIIAAYTKNAAWAAREDSISGTIETGKAADLIVLNRNLFQARAMDLHKVRVLLTLLDGEPVYRDPDFVWP